MKDSTFHTQKWLAGYPETVSGSGSMLESTVNVRHHLVAFIKKYNIFYKKSKKTDYQYILYISCS